jgi:hypothetical protein
VAVLGKGVFHHAGEGGDLSVGGDNLPADGVAGIIGVDQGDEVGGNLHAEKVLGAERGALGGGEGKHFLKIVGGVKTVAELPAPVIPFFSGDVLVNRGPAGGERGIGHA